MKARNRHEIETTYHCSEGGVLLERMFTGEYVVNTEERELKRFSEYGEAYEFYMEAVLYGPNHVDA